MMIADSNSEKSTLRIIGYEQKLSGRLIGAEIKGDGRYGMVHHLRPLKLQKAISEEIGAKNSLSRRISFRTLIHR